MKSLIKNRLRVAHGGRREPNWVSNCILCLVSYRPSGFLHSGAYVVSASAVKSIPNLVLNRPGHCSRVVIRAVPNTRMRSYM